MHGNHDWPFLRSNIPANYWWIGRLSISSINVITEYKYLPVVNNCIGFIFLSMTPIFLVKYWKLPETIFTIFSISALLLLHPLLLGIIYYLHLTYAYLLVPLLLIIGLILSEQKSYKLSALSICLFVFAFGDYNVCINTLAVIFLGKMLLEYANGNSFVQLFKKYLRTISIICLSGIIYFIIVQYLKHSGVTIEFYNTKILAFNQILPRMFTIFIDSFRHFYLIYPVMDLTYLILLSLLFVLMAGIVIYESVMKKIWYVVGILFLFILLIFSSKIVFCITANNLCFSDYLSYFSLVYVYVVAVAYIINSRLLWGKNLLFILFIPICFMSLIRDFEYQKYWKIGLDGDKRIISRLVERIEEQDSFFYDKEYRLVFIGYYTSFNSSYYNKQTRYNQQIFSSPFFPHWAEIENSMCNFMPRTYFKPNMMINFNTSAESIKQACFAIPKEYIMNLRPWPHKDSVLVYGDTIICCWQEKELEYVKKVLMESE